MQITLNGFTFVKNANGTDNIQSVLKNKDNKALGGIVKEGNKMAKLERLKQSPETLDFLCKVLEETNQVYSVQKAAKPRNKYKGKFNPNIHSVGA
ncbi:hypothetical protein GAP32_008 [Cronobacter phage vB_CsaM_GAP32]|uniref:Uncharacterized protein n=1 Tax=Cronobacter phage vB_CsaM_GAP32 TaxID=1141136 RepID=K4F9D2_9CAUD|nr:hypothetical protein GAP32_008 [Cronobacter phage vB_CsaM_GAP32]AFC21455.1 hypothetical protein GAP32_008 [Cronobacter phage vB_CsaM_GAP32]